MHEAPGRWVWFTVCIDPSSLHPSEFLPKDHSVFLQLWLNPLASFYLKNEVEVLGVNLGLRRLWVFFLFSPLFCLCAFAARTACPGSLLVQGEAGYETVGTEAPSQHVSLQWEAKPTLQQPSPSWPADAWVENKWLLPQDIAFGMVCYVACISNRWTDTVGCDTTPGWCGSHLKDVLEFSDGGGRARTWSLAHTGRGSAKCPKKGLNKGSFRRESLLPTQKIHASVFIRGLFTIAKAWQQPKCPPTDEWIKKMWYIYALEYYLAIKKK